MNDKTAFQISGLSRGSRSLSVRPTRSLFHYLVVSTFIVFVSIATASAERLECPGGTEIMGAPPPDGKELSCVKKTTGTTKVKHGPFIQFYSTGEKRVEGTYNNGEKDGLFITWGKAGTALRKERYVKGTKEGKWESYFPNGEMRALDEYRGGVLHGVRRRWFKTGAQASLESFEKGRKVGNTQSWGSGGQKLRSGAYDRAGRMTGVWTRWKPNGDKSSEGEYREGKKEGVWKVWGGDGTLAMTTEYKGGRIIRRTGSLKGKKGTAKSKQSSTGEYTLKKSGGEPKDSKNPKDGKDRPLKSKATAEGTKSGPIKDREHVSYQEALKKWREKNAAAPADGAEDGSESGPNADPTPSSEADE